MPGVVLLPGRSRNLNVFPLPGKPQRLNGKVSGRLFVGNSSSPEELRNQDLHSYVVANEGRTYVAISSIGAALGPSLRLLPALGGVIGWAFALEPPGFQNGFSVAGENLSAGRTCRCSGWR